MKPGDTFMVTEEHFRKAKDAQNSQNYDLCSQCLIAVAAEEHFGVPVSVTPNCIREQANAKYYTLEDKISEIIRKFDLEENIMLPVTVTLQELSVDDF